MVSSVASGSDPSGIFYSLYVSYEYLDNEKSSGSFSSLSQSQSTTSGEQSIESISTESSGEIWAPDGVCTQRSSENSSDEILIGE